jgi:hypothetical protein
MNRKAVLGQTHVVMSIITPNEDGRRSCICTYINAIRGGGKDSIPQASTQIFNVMHVRDMEQKVGGAGGSAAPTTCRTYNLAGCLPSEILSSEDFA